MERFSARRVAVRASGAIHGFLVAGKRRPSSEAGQE